MQDVLLVANWSDGRGGQRITLFGQTIRIGHDFYNDIVMPPEFTPHAPYHAAVVLQADGCYVYDPDKIGVIYLNGTRLKDYGIIKPNNPAYIGSPTHAKLYLRLSIEDIQLTQMIQTQTHLGMTELMQSIPNLPPSLPEHVIPYLLTSWHLEDYQLFELDQEVMVAGRSPAANINVPLQFNFVSALHFQVVKIDKNYYVQDKHSTNGTHLNRTLLEGGKLYPLSDGDIINVQSGSPDQLVWFIFHDPLNPKPTNLARATSPQTHQPTSLWEHIRNFLRRR